MWYVLQASKKAGYTLTRARDDFHRFAEFPGVTKAIFIKFPNFESAAGFSVRLAKQSPYFRYFIFKV